jgi:hypothetical protein
VNNEVGRVTEGSGYGLIVGMIIAFASSSCRGAPKNLFTISNVWIDI